MAASAVSRRPILETMGQGISPSPPTETEVDETQAKLPRRRLSPGRR